MIEASKQVEINFFQWYSQFSAQTLPREKK